MKQDYELQALLYAEKYGIIEYTVEGSVMTYEEYHRNEGRFVYTKDLLTGKETVEQTEFV